MNTKEFDDMLNFLKMNTMAFEFEEREDLFKYLYTALHLEGLYKPELEVYNAKPSEYRKEYLLPRDMFLNDEQNALATMPKNEFVKHCLDLENRKVAAAFGLIAGVNRMDKIRLTITLMPPVSEPGLPKHFVMVRVVGGTPEQNDRELNRIVKQIDESLQAK